MIGNRCRFGSNKRFFRHCDFVGTLQHLRPQQNFDLNRRGRRNIYFFADQRIADGRDVEFDLPRLNVRQLELAGGRRSRFDFPITNRDGRLRDGFRRPGIEDFAVNARPLRMKICGT